ncbi:MAG: energy-coupling factor transporter ATPase [Eggerthellaceae bacterium]|nr:energy-coupling factor transporter ATPase [Eggerthellaceae bacterium]
MIEFKHVSFSYDPAAAATAPEVGDAQADWGNAPDELWALRDVSFVLRDGEFLGIVGHTGSGKSTLVQHMNGLVAPTEGTVLVDGADISDKHAASQARARVGLVFQYPEHQLFAARVFDDVAFGPRNKGCSEDELKGVVRGALELVDMDFDAVRAMSPFELSGGQQRRVALAGVLAMHPDTLVLDEPAAGLDPEGRRELLALIRRLHQEPGSTVVMISHNMDDLAELADRILVLNQGTVWALGTPAEVFADADVCKSVGLDVPGPQRVANLLAQRGVGLPRPAGGLLSRAELVESIALAYRKGR